MPLSQYRHISALTLTVLVVSFWANSGAQPPANVDDSADNPDTFTEESLPFGAATSYMLGITLLEEGDFKAALPYLYQAYQLGGEAPEIAQAYLSVLLALRHRPEALVVLEGMIEQDQGNLELQRQRIMLLSDLQRVPEALAGVEDLRQSGDESLELLLVEAGLYSQAGQAEGAMAHYRLALDHPDAEAEKIYLLMLNLVQQTGSRQELADLWQEAVTTVPDSDPLRFGLLRNLVRSGKIEQARTLVDEADSGSITEQDGIGEDSVNDEVVWELELVDLLVQEQEFEPAVEILEERHRNNQLDLEASLWLARLLIRTNQPLKAQNLLQELVDRYPQSGRVHYYLGDLLASGGSLEAGEQEFREALQLEPRQPDYSVALVRLLTVKHAALLQQGNPVTEVDSARVEISNLARQASTLIDAQDMRSHMVLGYAFRLVDDLMRASEQFQAATEAPAFRKEALLQLAICYVDGERVDKAEQTLEVLWGEFPGDPVVANSLGYFLADRGVELERAEQLIRLAVADDPENGAYIDSLGWVLFKQGQYEDAFDQLVMAANAIPDDATILEHLGRTLHALGQADEAIRVLERAQTVGGKQERLSEMIQRLRDESEAP